MRSQRKQKKKKDKFETFYLSEIKMVWALKQNI